MPLYDTTNNTQTYDVPSNATRLYLRIIGGVGADGESTFGADGGDGGPGGLIEGELPVSGDETFTVTVGGSASGRTAGRSPLGDGGDGGAGGTGDIMDGGDGGGGGSASGVERQSDGVKSAAHGGGGGGGAGADDSGDGRGGGGGGGGSLGGLGGDGGPGLSDGSSGEDADGTGPGGDGGDGNGAASPGYPGDPGGTEVQSGLEAVTTDTSTNGPLVEIEPLPTTPTLSLGAVTNDSVALSWTDVDFETGYDINRREVGGSWSTVDSVGAGTTSYTDSTVLEGAAYEYRIVATNDYGTATSNVESATTDLPAPTDLTATQP